MNMLFNKVLGKNEKCVLFLPKDQRSPLANPICKCSLILKSNVLKVNEHSVVNGKPAFLFAVLNWH